MGQRLIAEYVFEVRDTTWTSGWLKMLGLDVGGNVNNSETIGKILYNLLNHHAEHVNLVEESHTQITKEVLSATISL